MEPINILYGYLDYFLIWFFRLPGNAVAGFYFGTCVLAFFCVLLGELSMGLMYLWNRSFYEKQMKKMVEMHNISIEAIRHKDKESFKASNKWANEYFGKVFFSQAALFAVSLWPVAFGLGWLAERFTNVAIPVPLTPWTVGYPFVMIFSYILLRVLFSRVKGRLPFFRHVRKIQKASALHKAEMKSWTDLSRPEDGEEK